MTHDCTPRYRHEREYAAAILPQLVDYRALLLLAKDLSIKLSDNRDIL